MSYLEIGITEEELQRLLEGEEFEWFFDDDKIGVRLFKEE